MQVKVGRAPSFNSVIKSTFTADGEILVINKDDCSDYRILEEGLNNFMAYAEKGEELPEGTAKLIHFIIAAFVIEFRILLVCFSSTFFLFLYYKILNRAYSFTQYVT